MSFVRGRDLAFRPVPCKVVPTTSARVLANDEMFVLGWVADYPDPNNFLDNLFYTGKDNNISGYSNGELDSLLEQAAIEPHNAARLSMYQQAEQQVLNQAPCLPLCFGRNYILVKPYVKDYELSPLGIPDLSQVYLEQSI